MRLPNFYQIQKNDSTRTFCAAINIPLIVFSYTLVLHERTGDKTEIPKNFCTYFYALTSVFTHVNK